MVFSTKMLRIKLSFQLSNYPYKKLYGLTIIFKITTSNNLSLKICCENIMNINFFFFFIRRKIVWTYYKFRQVKSRQVIPLERIYSHHKSRENTALNGHELVQKLWQIAMWFPHSYFLPYMNVIYISHVD